MKINGTCISSRGEEQLYNELCLSYGVDNVLRQYKDERYPYDCDFYIISEDLFIEYNGTWTHYIEPFDESNDKHLDRLSFLQEKSINSKYYSAAIKVWTISDVEKLRTFRDNNLNFKIIYPVSGLIITQ